MSLRLIELKFLSVKKRLTTGKQHTFATGTLTSPSLPQIVLVNLEVFVPLSAYTQYSQKFRILEVYNYGMTMFSFST